MFLKARCPEQFAISKPVSDPNQCMFTLMKSLQLRLAFVLTYEHTQVEGVGRKHTKQYLGVDHKDKNTRSCLLSCATRVSHSRAMIKAFSHLDKDVFSISQREPISPLCLNVNVCFDLRLSRNETAILLWPWGLCSYLIQ